MNLRQAIFSHLTGNGRVTALVGNRIYPFGELPVRVSYPLLTYHRIGNIHERHLVAGSGVQRARIQIDCWALGADDVDDAADAVREAMDNFRGYLGQGNDQLQVLGSFLEDDEQEFVAPADASHRGRHRVRMDWILVYQESITPLV